MTFDRTWSKDTIMHLVNSNIYVDFGKHDDLKALCISPFSDEELATSEYEELTFIVPKNWLAETASQLFNVTDIDTWLRNEYTTEQSEEIFCKALSDKMFVMADFI